MVLSEQARRDQGETPRGSTSHTFLMHLRHVLGGILLGLYADTSNASISSGIVAESGTVIVDTGDIVLDVTEGGSCIQACKLAVTTENTQADGYHVAPDYERDPVTRMFIYRTCRQGVCPTEPGEVIVKDCQCLNEFSSTVAAVETLRQAGIDMICSDGVMK